MLPYYHPIADFYLEGFDGFPAVKRPSRARPADPPFSRMNKVSLQGRGLLSRYWLSLNWPTA